MKITINVLLPNNNEGNPNNIKEIIRTSHKCVFIGKINNVTSKLNEITKKYERLGVTLANYIQMRHHEEMAKQNIIKGGHIN